MNKLKRIDGLYKTPNYHPENYQLRKWLRSLPTLSWVDYPVNRHSTIYYLIIPDWSNPSRTVIIKEEIPAIEDAASRKPIDDTLQTFYNDLGDKMLELGKLSDKTYGFRWHKQPSHHYTVKENGQHTKHY